MSMPAFIWLLPKVKRAAASTGAIPTVPIAMPNRPESSPLTIEPLESVAIIVREKTAMEKYS